jgi:hypothetical protein
MPNKKLPEFVYLIKQQKPVYGYSAISIEFRRFVSSVNFPVGGYVSDVLFSIEYASLPIDQDNRENDAETYGSAFDQAYGRYRGYSFPRYNVSSFTRYEEDTHLIFCQKIMKSIKALIKEYNVDYVFPHDHARQVIEVLPRSQYAQYWHEREGMPAMLGQIKDKVLWDKQTYQADFI